MNVALCDFSICGTLEKHSFTYLLTLVMFYGSKSAQLLQCSHSSMQMYTVTATIVTDKQTDKSTQGSYTDFDPFAMKKMRL